MAAPVAIAVRPSTRAWWALAVLVLATLFAYVDRQVLVLVVEPLKHDLRLSDAQIGALQGLGFALFSVVASLPLAWLADRFARAKIMAICVLTWSAATAACGLADSFGALFTATVGMAVGEAALVPIVYALIPDLFPEGRRVQANIVFYGATVLGVGLGLAFSATVLGAVSSAQGILPQSLHAMASWRITFLALSLPGPPIALAIAWVARTTPRIGPAHAKTRPAAAGDRLLNYFRVHGGTVARLYAGIGFGQAAGLILFTWLPAALVRFFGLSSQSVGTSFGLSYSAGAGIGLIGAATTVSLWRRLAGIAAPVRALAVVSALAALPSLLFGVVREPWEAYLLLGVTIALGSTGSALAPAMLQDMAPQRLRARVIAVGTIVYTLIGASGPLAVGFLSDRLSGSKGLLLAVVVVMTPAFVLSAACYRSAEQRFRWTVQILRGAAEFPG